MKIRYILILTAILIYLDCIDAQITCNYTAKPVTFAAAASTVSDLDSNGLQDIRLAFNSDRGYTNVDFSFVGSGTRCNSINTQTGTWNVIQNSSANCNRTFVYTADLNQALQYCNFERIEGVRSSNITTYRSVIMITTSAWIRVIRNVNISASYQSSVSVDLDFNNFVQTTSTNLSITSGFDPTSIASGGGSGFLLVRILTQAYDIGTSTFSLQTLTSASWPYQMSFASLSDDPSWNVLVYAEQPGPLAANGTSNITARCDDGALGPVAGTSGIDGTYNAGNPCNQYWRIILRRNLNCPMPTNMNRNWTLSFNVGCHSMYTGSCGLSETNTYGSTSVKFETASDNLCPTILDVETPSPPSITFQQAAIGNSVTNSFPVGTASGANIAITSPILLEYTLIERITIVSGGPTPNLILYTNLVTDVGNITANQRPCRMSLNNCTTGRFNVSGGRASNLSPTLLQVNDLPNGNPNMSTATWVWSNYTAFTSGDAPTTVLVRIDVRVRFADQSTVSDKRYSLLNHARPQLLFNTRSGFAEGVVFITASSNNDNNNNNNNINNVVSGVNGNDNNNNNNNEIELGSLQIIGLIGAVVGLFGTIATVALVVRMNRQKKYYQDQTCNN